MPRLGALGILFVVNTAWAADLPEVAVVGVHQGELDAAEQARAVQALVHAVDASKRAKGLDSAAVAAAIAGREEVILSDGLLGPGRRLLADGRNLYNQAAPEDAVAVLEQAVASLRLGQAAVNNTKDLWEAWIYLGTSLMSLDRPADADIAFRAAVALNPIRSPNPALFPPPVVQAYDSARAALAGDTVTLRVEVDGDATVYVDGQSRGRGSVTVTDVYPGEHYVLARGDGVQAYERIVITPPMAVPEDAPPGGEAPDGAEGGGAGSEGGSPAPGVTEEPDGAGASEADERQVVAVKLTLGPPSLGAPADTATSRGLQTAALYRALGDHAVGVELVLLAGVADDRVHLQLYAPNTDAFSKPVDVPYEGAAYDEAAESLPLLLELLDNSGHLPPGTTSPVAVPLDLGSNSELASLLTQPQRTLIVDSAPPTTQRRKSKVLPVLLGVVGVAAAGSATYLGVQAARPQEPTMDGTVIVGPF